MDIRAEVLTIGDEILWGQIVDSNSAFMCAELTKIGVRTVCKTSVGDSKYAVTDALQAALTRAEIVLITGGLGPTKDDITKKTLADFFNATLVEHPQAWDNLQQMFARRGRVINELNRAQALLPDKATYIPNDKGTAPGMLFTTPTGQLVVSMPGVPFEMKHMLLAYVVPKIKEAFTTPIIVHRFLQTVGIPEAELALRLEAWEDALPSHIKLAYLPSRGRVKLRLTGTGAQATLLKQDLEHEAAKAIPVLGKYLFSHQDQELEQYLTDLFVAQNLTLAAAESCTGGAFAQRVTAWPGAGSWFNGSAVVYTREAKIQLGVRPDIIDEQGIVSEACARAMAIAAKAFYGADYAVACTGVAGPGLPTDTPPVGTIHIACAGPGGAVVHQQLALLQDRAINIDLTVINMLNMVRLQIENA